MAWRFEEITSFGPMLLPALSLRMALILFMLYELTYAKCIKECLAPTAHSAYFDCGHYYHFLFLLSHLLLLELGTRHGLCTYLMLCNLTFRCHFWQWVGKQVSDVWDDEEALLFLPICSWSCVWLSTRQAGLAPASPLLHVQCLSSARP